MRFVIEHAGPEVHASLAVGGEDYVHAEDDGVGLEDVHVLEDPLAEPTGLVLNHACDCSRCVCSEITASWR